MSRINPKSDDWAVVERHTQDMIEQCRALLETETEAQRIAHLQGQISALRGVMGLADEPRPAMGRTLPYSEIR